MSRHPFFTDYVAGSFTEADFLKIRQGIASFCQLILPGNGAPTGAVIELSSFLFAQTESQWWPSLIAQREFAHILALAFLLGENNFGKDSVFVEMENARIKRLHYQPSQCLFVLKKQIKKEIKLDVESRYTKKNAKYFPEIIEGEPDCWPTKVTTFNKEVALKFVKLQENNPFQHDAYFIFLKIALMPMLMVKNIFSALDLEEQKAVFIAEQICRNNVNFLKQLLTVEKFVEWYLSAPKKIMEDCWGDYSALVNEETSFYMRSKITFLFAEKKVKMILEKFALLNQQLARNKMLPQTGGNGSDLQAICIALCDFFNERIPFLDEEKAPLLEWNERLFFLSKKTKFIVSLFDKVQIMVIGESNAVFDAIKKLHESLWFFTVASEESDFVCIEEKSTDVDLAEKNLDALTAAFFAWINCVNHAGVLVNHVTIVSIFHRIYDDYLESKKKTSSQLYSAVSSGRLMAAGLWGRVTSSTSVAQSEPVFSAPEFERLETLLFGVIDVKQLENAFNVILAIQGSEIEVVHRKFMTELVLQFQREVCAREIIFQEDLSMARALSFNSNYTKLVPIKIESMVAEAIRIIRNAVSSQDDDGMVIVSSQQFSAVSSAKAGS